MRSKKLTLLASIMMLFVFNIINAKNIKIVEKTKEEKKFEKIMKKFELEATIHTTKGDINVFLYPEAAPVNVANFVFLAKKGFYDGLTFHRVITNGIVQGGDPKGDGTGSAGYYVDDEFVNWLNFNNSGVLAMANSGKNTNGSQFFISLQKIPSLNGVHTIIGGLKSGTDLAVAKIIRQGDKIKSIDIKGKKVDDFLSYFSVETSEWESKMQNN